MAMENGAAKSAYLSNKKSVTRDLGGCIIANCLVGSDGVLPFEF
jgi:hypothetical protein